MSETTTKSEKTGSSFPRSFKDLGLSDNTIDLIYQLSPILAVGASLILGAILFVLAGVNPVSAYIDLALGAFSTPTRISETLIKFTPLLLGGLAIVISFKTSVFNTGGYGQIYFGALGAVAISYIMAQVIPLWIPNVLVGYIVGFLMGGSIALIPAFMKTELQTSEVVTCVMLNYVALYVSWFLISEIGPFHLPEDSLPYSWDLGFDARVPRFYRRLHLGFFVALLAVPLVWLLMTKLTLGYEMRATGLNRTAARCSGINTRRATWLAMFFAGGLFGLAGAGEVMGVYYRLHPEYVPNEGWNSIPVAILANLDPIMTIFSALFYGALRQGGRVVQILYTVPGTIVEAIQGAMLIFLLISYYFKNRREQSL